MIINVRTEDNNDLYNIEYVYKNISKMKYKYILNNFPNNCFDICENNKTLSLRTLVMISYDARIDFYFCIMYKNEYKVVFLYRILNNQKEKKGYDYSYYGTEYEIPYECEEWINTYVKQSQEGKRIIKNYLGI